MRREREREGGGGEIEGTRENKFKTKRLRERMRVMESKRERERDETGEHKKEWGIKLKADYPLSESLVSLRIRAELCCGLVGGKELVFFFILVCLFFSPPWP